MNDVESLWEQKMNASKTKRPSGVLQQNNSMSGKQAPVDDDSSCLVKTNRAPIVSGSRSLRMQSRFSFEATENDSSESEVAIPKTVLKQVVEGKVVQKTSEVTLGDVVQRQDALEEKVKQMSKNIELILAKVSQQS
mmetsp:Transcript_30740/g.42573  ORF Transcript_30740/g.42573 Transcript_30740/m.42573 type:complete len:136 (-) Transcript_30740:108-515(-)